MVWALTEQFHCYLYGSKFTLRTDNRPLSWLRKLKKRAPRLARWILKLQEYEFEIIHRPGTSNSNTDTLSRLPVNTILLQSNETADYIRSKQFAHPDLLVLIDFIEADEPHTDNSFLYEFQRRLLSRSNEFAVEDGILIRRVANHRQVVVQQVCAKIFFARFTSTQPEDTSLEIG